ncbi:hypothetical protein ACFL0O_00350 [Thermodesulfobacteriota bacterium]
MALHSKIWLHQRMTKKFLMSLPEGAFMESGVMWECRTAEGLEYCDPYMSELVAPLAEREAQWQKIKQKYCEGRHFIVFKSKADFQVFLETSPLGNEMRTPGGWRGHDSHRP